MLRQVTLITAVSAFLLGSGSAFALNPEADREAFIKHYTTKFSSVEPADFTNGAYSLPAYSHGKASWEAIEVPSLRRVCRERSGAI